MGGDLYLGSEPPVISEPVRKLFREADFSVVNLEAPVILAGDTLSPVPKAGPVLSQGESALSVLANLNIQFVSVANNHSMDHGASGMKKTIGALASRGIAGAGFGETLAQARRPIEFPGTEIAMVCAAEEEFGVAEDKKPGVFSLYGEDIIREIQSLREKGKFVIVFAHGGGEKIPLSSLYIRDRFREFILEGAGAVVGHHPHVPQGTELFHDKPIIYSLGNFAHNFYKHSSGLLATFVIRGTVLERYEVAPVLFRDNTVSLAEKEEKRKWLEYLDICGKILCDQDIYEGVRQEAALRMYEGYYEKYFTGLFTERLSVREALSRFIKRMLGLPTYSLKKKVVRDRLLLLHLLRNRSHKEFIETALMLKTGETTNKITPLAKKTLDTLMAHIS